MSETEILDLMEDSINKRIITVFEDESGELVIKDSTLDIVTFEITKQCNLQCIHCYNSSSPFVEKKVITLQEYGRFLKQLKKMKVFQLFFTGGEPLFVENIDEYFKLAKKNGFDYGIFTNGVFVGKWFNFFLKYRPNEFFISLDSLDNEKYKKIRGIDVSKVIDNIILLRDFGFKVRLNVTLFKGLNDSFDDIKSLFDFGKRINSEVVVDELDDFGRGKVLKNYVYGDKMAILKRINDAYFSVHGKNFYGNKSYFSNYSFCGVGEDRIFVRSDGKITLCPLLNEDEHIIGDIRDNNIRKIWQNHPLLNFIRNKEYLNEKCKKCPLKQGCFGGCIGKSWQKYGDYSHIDEFNCLKKTNFHTD